MSPQTYIPNGARLSRTKPSDNRTNPRVQALRSIEKPPIDFDPLVLTKKGVAIDRARKALGKIFNTWTTVADLAKDESIESGDLAKAGRGAVQKALKQADDVIGDLGRQASRLGGGLDHVLPEVPDALAAEIRGHWARTGGGVHNALKAVRSDPRTAAALLGAPAYLSGLDEADLKDVRDVAWETYAGSVQEELDGVERAKAVLGRATERLRKQVAEPLEELSELASTNAVKKSAAARGLEEKLRGVGE